MSRLNPLYILLLSFIVALFAAYSASKKQTELEELQSEYHTKEDIALRLHALKKAYSPKRKRELLRLLGSGLLKKSAIHYSDKKDRLIISGTGVDVKAANTIVSKVLNGTYNLKRFSLRRAKEGIDLEMEIVWR